jgi:uncharacterized protein YdeI (YjbR/CyaY-like superfamily)
MAQLAGDGFLMIELRDLSVPEWRKWLERNHASEGGAWLHLYKKHAGKGRMSYDEAVEQALCFGWIDGTLKRIDDETHKIRFTPRRRNSAWADSNVRRVKRLIAEGQMTPHGLAAIGDKVLNRPLPGDGRSPRRFQLRGEMRARLMAHPAAWAAYLALSPSRREQYARWLAAARREPTKAKRLARVAEMLEKGDRRAMIY